LRNQQSKQDAGCRAHLAQAATEHPDWNQEENDQYKQDVERECLNHIEVTLAQAVDRARHFGTFRPEGERDRHSGPFWPGIVYGIGCDGGQRPMSRDVVRTERIHDYFMEILWFKNVGYISAFFEMARNDCGFDSSGCHRVLRSFAFLGNSSKGSL
jgi:hypothetical protein